MSLYLKLFGGLSLVDSETGAVRVTRRHRLAALAVLASAEGPVPRERLLAPLWPDASDEGGRHSLGQVLYGLRQDVGLVELAGLNWRAAHRRRRGSRASCECCARCTPTSPAMRRRQTAS